MIYLDCGFFRGVNLQQLIDKGTVDDSWKIYAWEPNPEYKIDEYSADMPVKVKGYQKAVWTKTGTMDLYIHGFDNAHSLMIHYKHADPIKVKTIDFSKFVAGLPDEYILCNMDIEGAEYDVLEKMIKDGTIKKINVLDIEYHDRLMNEKNENDSKELTNKLRDLGVEVRVKNDGF